MPNTSQINSEINQELVKAFNVVLLFDETFITNLAVEENHIVLSFDKNMNDKQQKKYLSDMRKSIVEKFCGNEKAANDLFYTKFFPLNFDQGKSTEDNKFLVPIEKEVICNLKYLLANELVRFTTNTIMENYSDLDYVEDNMFDESFDRKSYLYCIRFSDTELKNSFVNSFSSKVKSYKNGPKKTKDFLEEKGNSVYIKRSTFDNPKFIKDIVMDKVSLTYRNLEMPRDENETIKILKFAIVDLIRKALPHLPIDSIWHFSHRESKDEFSILAPVVNKDSYIELLDEKEVNYINKEVFDKEEVLCDLGNNIAQRNLPVFSGKKIYAIDFVNPNIAYCVMNKVIENSVINKDHQLFIDPEHVPVMKSQTLAPSKEIGTDGPSVDSGFGGLPKNPTIRTGNSRNFLRPDYCGEGRYGASAKDSGIGGDSSARSSFDKPKAMLDQASVSQPDQCSAKKRTSISKLSCRIL